jgi:uncharacterized protein (DUF433 family)
LILSDNSITFTKNKKLNGMIDWTLHIESTPEILYGKPVIRNTRIPVDLILEKLAAGDTNEDLLDAYPKITRDDIAACLLFAAESIKNEIILSKAS